MKKHWALFLFTFLSSISVFADTTQDKKIADLENRITSLENRILLLEQKPLFECSANCGFYSAHRTGATLFFLSPMTYQGNSIGDVLHTMETECANKGGILFGGVEYLGGLQKLIPVKVYPEIDLTQFACRNL